MATLLGDLQSTTLIRPDRLGNREFIDLLTGLRHRHDRAEAAAEYVGAVATIGPGSFNLSDLGRILGPEPSNRDRLRNLIERSRWSTETISDGLLRSAVAAEIDAIAVELHNRVDKEGRGRDILVLMALGDGFTIPLEWECVEYPPLVPGVVDAVRGGVLRMIERFASRWLGLVAEDDLPPLLAADPFFGEDRALRDALRSRSVAYQLRVPAEYDEAEPVRHPYEDAEPERTLAELLPAGGEPIELEAPHRSEAEHAVALPAGGYALVYPGLESGPQGLLGYRPRRQAAELAELVPPGPGTIESLRVADFDYATPQALARHANLVSLHAVFSRSRFNNGKEER